jgi:hypothetical protein
MHLLQEVLLKVFIHTFFQDPWESWVSELQLALPAEIIGDNVTFYVMYRKRFVLIGGRSPPKIGEEVLVWLAGK